MNNFLNLKARIREIWEGCLDIEINDDSLNFFSLGGVSIQALEIIDKLNTTMNINIEIGDFFNNLTINDLSNFIFKEYF